MTVPLEAVQLASAAHTAKKEAKRQRKASSSAPASSPAPGSAADHRAKIDAIRAERPPETPATPAAGDPAGGPPAALTDQRGAPDWYRKAASPDPVAAANAGGGFLLGLGVWAVGLAYLRGGPAEVRKLLASKFLNRVTS